MIIWPRSAGNTEGNYIHTHVDNAENNTENMHDIEQKHIAERGYGFGSGGDMKRLVTRWAEVCSSGRAPQGIRAHADPVVTPRRTAHPSWRERLRTEIGWGRDPNFPSLSVRKRTQTLGGGGEQTAGTAENRERANLISADATWTARDAKPIGSQTSHG